MSWFICRTAGVASLWIIGLMLSIVATVPSYAACPPGVTPAESPAGPQTIGSGEECTVEEGASIFSDGANGITANDGNTIVNNGIITTTGNFNYGLEADDQNNVLNTGTISTTGDSSIAVSIDDDGAVVNRGVITTSGASAYGIDAGDDGVITNTGIIRTTGADAAGIDASDSNVITNAGTISVTGFGIIVEDDNTIVNSGLVEITAIRTAIDLDGERNVLTNTGTIRTTRNFSRAISADDDNVINNSGLISTSGTDADAFFVLGGNTITNSGAIVAEGPGSVAVNLFRAENTLNLLQGSRVVGLIEFGEIDGADNTVTLGRGENWLMTFSEDPLLRNSLSTSGVPTAFINGGLTVATFDAATTVFGAEKDALSDLTNAINATLHHRLTAGNPTTYVWAQGFGAMRNADGDNGPFQPVAANNEVAGGMIGFSTPLTSSARGGLFVGFADGSIQSQRANSVGDNSHRHEIDQQSWFAGAYGRAFWGQAFADVIVTAGQTDNDSARRILNNLALKGVEFARGSYDGWFVNPELTLGVEMPFGASSKLVPSVSVGYVGLFLDGLTETGSQAAVTLDERDVELINGRLQLEVRTVGETSAGPWQSAIRAGVRGSSSIGDENLAGILAVTTAFNVTPEDSDDAIAGFLGADLTFSVASNTQVFAGAETAFEDDGDSIFTGRAGVALKF